MCSPPGCYVEAVELDASDRRVNAGDELGSYVIVRQIGSGGMGSVYLAEHTALGRRAAIKVLQPELSTNQQMLTRFFNEARAASAIKSPGIVEIYDFGRSADGSAYIVMELLEGEPLSARLARLGKLPIGSALVIARQITSALAPAHRAGIVHRDLKPDNVFLVPDAEVAGGERVKLLDFGIAKLLGDDERSGGVRLTSTKTVMGTPYYMSPEQCRGAGGVDARSDLYALGCILYELVSGQTPFSGEGAGDLIGAHIYLPPRKLVELMPEVPVEVDQLVQRLLSKAAAQRPQSAEEVAAALSALATRFSATWASPTVVPPGSASAAPPVYPRADQGTPMAVVSRVPQRAEAPKKDRRLLLAVASGLLLLAVVVVYAAVRGEGAAQQLAQSPVETSSERSSDTAIDAAMMPVAPIDAAKAITVVDAASGSGSATGSGSGSSLVAKRAECARAQSEERWADLKSCASELRTVVGAQPADIAAAREFLRRGSLEMPAKSQYDKFVGAQGRGDMRGMATIASSINAASMYSAQVQDKWASAKRLFIASKLADASTAAKGGMCDELRVFASEVQPYDVRAAEAILKLSCTKSLAIDCNEEARLAEAGKLFNDVQAARISDPEATIVLVEEALANKCLASKKNVLVRIGVVAACSEKRPTKTRFFYAITKDPSLVQACPEYLDN